MKTSHLIKPGIIVGGAIIHKEIGIGGQARVFLGTYGNEEVAVKVMLAPDGYLDWSSKTFD